MHSDDFVLTGCINDGEYHELHYIPGMATMPIKKIKIKWDE